MMNSSKNVFYSIINQNKNICSNKFDIINILHGILQL